MKRIRNLFRQWKLRRPLLDEEKAVLEAVRERYPAHRRDVIFFVEGQRPPFAIRSLAIIQVWGANGEGPWVHLTNLASWLQKGVATIEEIKRDYLM